MEPTPDKEDPDKRPPSRGTSAESSEDRKFWGLDEDEEELEAAEEEDDPAAEAEDDPTAEAEDDPTAEAEDDPAAEAEDDPAAEAEDDPAAEAEDDPAAEAEDAPREEEPDEPEEEPDQSASSPPAPEPTPEAPVRPRLDLSRSDKIWMGALALILLILAIVAFSMFKSNIPTVGGPDEVDFPVKGELVVIAKVSTFWRKPDREVDRVKIDAHLIPCAKLTLKGGSGTGKLRLFFKNDEGDVVGDPVSIDFADGSFRETGSKVITVNATDGFKSEGEYNAYVPEKINFWHLTIHEGPATGVGTGEFAELLRTRISPKRH